MEWLGVKLGYKKMEDWYNISVHDFRANSGAGILDNYSNSPSKIVTELFSTHNWKQWLFRCVHGIIFVFLWFVDLCLFLSHILKESVFSVSVQNLDQILPPSSD